MCCSHLSLLFQGVNFFAAPQNVYLGTDPHYTLRWIKILALLCATQGPLHSSFPQQPHWTKERWPFYPNRVVLKVLLKKKYCCPHLLPGALTGDVAQSAEYLPSMQEGPYPSLGAKKVSWSVCSGVILTLRR